MKLSFLVVVMFLWSDGVAAVPLPKPRNLGPPTQTVGVGSRGCNSATSSRELAILTGGDAVLLTSREQPAFVVKNVGWANYRVTVTENMVPMPLFDRSFQSQGFKRILINSKLTAGKEYRFVLSTKCSDYPSDTVFAQVYFRYQPISDKEVSSAYSLDAIADAFELNATRESR